MSSSRVVGDLEHPIWIIQVIAIDVGVIKLYQDAMSVGHWINGPQSNLCEERDTYFLRQTPHPHYCQLKAVIGIKAIRVTNEDLEINSSGLGVIIMILEVAVDLVVEAILMGGYQGNFQMASARSKTKVLNNVIIGVITLCQQGLLICIYLFILLPIWG